MHTPAATAPTSGERRGPVGFEQRLLARGRALACPPGIAIVVGFSGGADSLALAAALGRVGPGLGLRPTLAHVDHGLRDIAHEEQRWAGELAAALGLPFLALGVGEDPRARHPGVGVEEAARRERYRLLAGAVGGAGIAGGGPALLALAHHEGDQAETALLHLLRGAGLTGAAGMAERSRLTVPWWDDGGDAPPTRVEVWRPLLQEPRAAVRGYAAGLGLDWIEDPSNEDRSLRRNALRHEALPALERISPGATAALARYGRLAAAEDAALEALAAAAAGRGATAGGGFSVDALAAEPAAIRGRAVRRWLRQRTGCRGVTADRTEAVLGLLAPGEGGRRVEVGEGWVVEVRRGELSVGRTTARRESRAGPRLRPPAAGRTGQPDHDSASQPEPEPTPEPEPEREGERS